MIDEDKPFRLEEATIDELHRAIRAGRTSCGAIVRHYIGAFNGVASALVTKNGAPVPEASALELSMQPGQPLKPALSLPTGKTQGKFFSAEKYAILSDACGSKAHPGRETAG
jgi:hypothetical protein